MSDSKKTDRPNDPWLLTPGPLTTSAGVKQAMLRDWGSRDPAFIAMTARVRERLVALAGGQGSHVCVPLQGSGTFVVEAGLGTLIPRGGKALVLVNGAYGARIAKILTVIGRAHEVYETPEDTPPDPDEVARRLGADPAIGHVVLVHCETTSGILNPVEAIAGVVAAAGRALILDAMSAFGALPLDLAQTPVQAVLASANKCLEGVPGIGFALIRAAALDAAAGNAPSLSLDLHDQWRGLEANGQWRFTPPTHVLAALDQALNEHAAEGGVAGRGARYAQNCKILVEGLQALGLELYLPQALQAPIIVTAHAPADPAFDFKAFYEAVAEAGYLIYPGKLTRAETFRVGCIGRLGEAEMRGATAAIGAALDGLGVKDRGPRS
ncbi:MAG TPA: 2-aminoethylphosphonate--pyruvate transaminase [Alphaproteobacteria bacterium]|nr:2-aminoethylphosphonate--pyruvate transaminase [Alphaproteobacteria bacterium]